MLAQLLGGYHPLGSELSTIDASTLAGTIQPFSLTKPIKKVEDVEFLNGVLNSSLCPDPSRRPSAEQISAALLGKIFDWKPWIPTKLPSVVRQPAPPAEPAVSSATSAPLTTSVQIFFETQEVAAVRVDTSFGKNHFLKVHEDARFLSNPQFHLARSGTEWTIRHDPSATNATLVDGAVPEGAVPLRDGMVVAVGNPAKGITKFPLTIRLATV